MQRFVVLVSLALTWLALVTGQQNSGILSESRYLSNNGQFGAAYKQANGVEFKEESDAEGNRRGSYSYVDPNGQKLTVDYTAGKDGFKATGDHLPVAPTPIPAAPAVALAPKTQWAQSVASRQRSQWSSEPTAKNDDGQWNEKWNRESVGKYDDGQWNEKWNSEPAAKYDDGQWSDIWNSAPAVKHDDGLWNQWNSIPTTPVPKYDPWNQWNSSPTTAKWSHLNSAAPTKSQYNEIASGKLTLNRTPDGYSYSYSQN